MYNYIILGIVAIIVAWIIGSYLVVRNLEEPSYTVIEKKDGYEVRQYKDYIIAETEVTGNYDKGLNQGFSVIADYIFGNNTTKTSISMTAPVLESRSEKISMTVPVINTVDSEKTRKISFVLPSKYTLETLPKPNNSAVSLKEVKGRKVAVRRFTWYATEKRITKQTNILEKKLVADKVTITDVPQVAQYNPPLSFPFTLRNEIIIPIE